MLGPKRQTDLPSRKRKAVSYKDAGGDVSGSDAENDDPDDRGGKKSKTEKGKGYAMGNKEYDDNGVLGKFGAICMRKFPVFAVKTKGQFGAKR